MREKSCSAKASLQLGVLHFHKITLRSKNFNLRSRNQTPFHSNFLQFVYATVIQFKARKSAEEALDSLRECQEDQVLREIKTISTHLIAIPQSKIPDVRFSFLPIKR